MANFDKSQKLFEKALRHLPGGVDSPVRAFKAVGGKPVFIERGEGPYLIDVDGNRYIDYVLSWGPLILGHAHPRVVAALNETTARGTSFGTPSPLEVELAELVKSFMPGLEKIRFVNSGTEATMSALRVARAATGRDKIIKFAGCYHGHADMLLVKTGSGVATLGLPDSPGVPQNAVEDTLVARYNDLDSVERLFQKNRGEIAAVIVEPVAGNMGLVLPADGFLSGLREMTADAETLLVFDEVMTGFRVHRRGAQTLYDVQPDLTTLGKVLGGGLPVGAYAGKSDIMEMVAPSGPVYQAGTLSGNPLVMRAGIETLNHLKEPGVWEAIDAAGERLIRGIGDAASAAGVPIVASRVGTMFGIFFADAPVTDWDSAASSNTERFARFFRAMLERGVYLAPSQFEAAFLSTAHDDEVIDATIRAAMQSFAAL